MIKKIGIILASALFAGALFTGCNPNKYVDLSGIDWTDYSDCSIKIKNSSPYNVVCFKGEADAANLISGAKSGCVTGLKNDSSLFSSTSDFILYAYKESDYVNCVDLKEIKDKPMCKLYAYYNADSSSRSNNVYEISSKLGGDCYFVINNSTNYNCEFRKDGLYGEPFCYAGAMTLKTTVYADSGDYDFFPVFRKYDKNSGAIITSYPKTESGYPQYESVGLSTTGVSAVELDCSKYLSTTSFTMAASAAYVCVNNLSSNGVKLYKGSQATATTTDTGIEIINSAQRATFTVPLDVISNSTEEVKYEDSVTIGSWQVGSPMYKITIPTITLAAGYKYYLDVEGSTYTDITAKWETYSADDPEGKYKKGDYVKYQMDLE